MHSYFFCDDVDDVDVMNENRTCNVDMNFGNSLIVKVL